MSLQPTLTVQGVGFANPPGFSRPQMATLERLDLKLALLPLLSHQVEIDRLVLVKPDILLETDAKGQPNWQFTQAARARRRSRPPAAQAGRPPTRISVADVRIEDGTVTLRDGASGRTTVLGVKSLEASAASPDANLHVAGDASYNGTPFTLAGRYRAADPACRSRSADSAWPVQLTMEAAGAKLTVDGTRRPAAEGRGYAMKVAANVPDLAALSVFVPGKKLPPLHDVAVAAQVADTGAPLPEISGLTLHVGPSDLTGMVAGAQAGQAGRHRGAARSAGAGLRPGQLRQFACDADRHCRARRPPCCPVAGAATPIPLDLNLQAAGSSLSVKGTAASGAGGRPSVQAEVKSDMIDADQLRALVAKAPGVAAGPPVAAAAPAAGRLRRRHRPAGVDWPADPRHADPVRSAAPGRCRRDAEHCHAEVGRRAYRAIAPHLVAARRQAAA